MGACRSSRDLVPPLRKDTPRSLPRQPVPSSLVHPGARPTNGLVQKMGRFPWQELDEVGDFGRFPVKKRPVVFYF
jgi:hypothetical protein